VLPKGNEADVRELPENVRREMEVHLAERIEDVLAVTVPQVGHKLQPVPV
jgi:ATP-dependent Lon protease